MAEQLSWIALSVKELPSMFSYTWNWGLNVLLHIGRNKQEKDSKSKCKDVQFRYTYSDIKSCTLFKTKKTEFAKKLTKCVNNNNIKKKERV